MNKKLILIFVFVFMVYSVAAFGISPGGTTFDFESGAERVVVVKVFNEGGQAKKLLVYSEGELMENIVLNEKEVVFVDGESEKEFSYVVRMPEELSEGEHGGIIVFEDESGIGIESTLNVKVPYVNDLVEVEMEVFDSEEESLATFYVTLINRGKEIIEDGRAKIEIFDSLGEKVASFDLGPFSLYPDRKAQLKSEWLVSAKKGEYTAKINFKAGKFEKNYEEKFMIDTPAFSVESVSVEEYLEGDIVKLRMTLLNRLEEDMDSVTVGIEVTDSFGNVLAQSKSLSDDLPKLTQKDFFVYLNKENLKDGRYDAKIFYNRGEKTKEENVRIEVYEGEVSVFRGSPVLSPVDYLTPINIVVALVVLLVLINIIWFFARRKKKKFR